jgi:hypothetical protein
MLSHDDVTHDCINDIVSDLQHMFIHTAKSTFGYTLNEQRSTDKNPWFDNTSQGHEYQTITIGSNLVLFNRTLVVPYEISKVNFHAKKNSCQYVRRDLINLKISI